MVLMIAASGFRKIHTREVIWEKSYRCAIRQKKVEEIICDIHISLHLSCFRGNR